MPHQQIDEPPGLLAGDILVPRQDGVNDADMAGRRFRQTIRRAVAIPEAPAMGLQRRGKPRRKPNCQSPLPTIVEGFVRFQKADHIPREHRIMHGD